MWIAPARQFSGSVIAAGGGAVSDHRGYQKFTEKGARAGGHLHRSSVERGVEVEQALLVRALVRRLALEILVEALELAGQPESGRRGTTPSWERVVRAQRTGSSKIVTGQVTRLPGAGAQDGIPFVIPLR